MVFTGSLELEFTMGTYHPRWATIF
jgi:hypothetical protein